jgi:hypothetical protein
LKPKIFALTLLLFASSLWAHDHPWPSPTATFAVTDVGSRISPITCSGTTSLHVDRKSDGTVASWVGGNHLTITNVSDKIITKVLLEVRWQDAHGEGNSVIHYDLDFSDPADSLQPGGHWTTSGVHGNMPKMKHTAAEFDSLPTIAPKLRAHALSVTFSDGSTYTESPDDKERPW